MDLFGRLSNVFEFSNSIMFDFQNTMDIFENNNDPHTHGRKEKRSNTKEECPTE